MTQKTKADLEAELEARQTWIDELERRVAELESGSGPVPPWEDPKMISFAEAAMLPFPPEAIGKIPRGGAQLDFVGHADVTARLLALDPAWTWRPMAHSEDGTPAMTKRGETAELWIELTVRGVTRPGVGTAHAAKADVSKELISDALRNAAMRFGLALDLWSKSDHFDASFGIEDAPVSAERAAEMLGGQMIEPGTPVSEAQGQQESVPAEGRTNTRPANGNAQRGSTASPDREVVMNGFLHLTGSVAKEARDRLSDKGLWPILDISDDRISEAADIIAPFVEAAS